MKDKKLYITIAVLDVIAAALIIWNLQLVRYIPNVYANYYHIRDVMHIVVITLGLFVGLEEKYIHKGKKSTMYLFAFAAFVNAMYLLRLFSHKSLEAISDVHAGLSIDSMVTGSEILFLVSFLIPAVIAVTCGVMAGLRAYKLNEELKAEEDNTNT